MAYSGKTLLVAAALSMMALSGCGTTTSDRAISGGLLGAGAGAVIGSVTGSAGKGAVIGGVAGAATGAVTRPDQVNLGTPVWRTCTRRNSAGKCLAGHN
jgi:osmotically inducible lipoprotein OsmB